MHKSETSALKYSVFNHKKFKLNVSSIMPSGGTFGFSTLEEGDPYNSTERKKIFNWNNLTNCVRIVLYIELIIFIAIFGLIFLEIMLWEIHRPHPVHDIDSEIDAIENATDKIINDNDNNTVKTRSIRELSNWISSEMFKISLNSSIET